MPRRGAGIGGVCTYGEGQDEIVAVGAAQGGETCRCAAMSGPQRTRTAAAGLGNGTCLSNESDITRRLGLAR